ncbi:MAG: adenine deaminase, partial [Sphingobacteriia bacterium]
GKPIDGHAPGLRGAAVAQYIAAGISTDHECFTREEAEEKLSLGMKILIREGSAAKNFEALWPLVASHPRQVMFCSDDKHPDGLLLGHINQICARAVAKGLPLFAVLRAATLNPMEHYQLPVGRLRVGDPADFIVVEDLENFSVLASFKNGRSLAEKGKSLLRAVEVVPVNRFQSNILSPADLVLSLADYPAKSGQIPVMEALDGQLITPALWCNATTQKNASGQEILVSNTHTDVLKIVVVNRYRKAPVAKAFVKNFGLQAGAIASSVAHDSHNIVAVGVSDAAICAAVNAVMAEKGGLSCVDEKGHVTVLGLPVAGLMSAGEGYAVADQYTAMDAAAKALGTPLAAPFMTLSFMALLVIPHLKLSDLGLFDGDQFCFLKAQEPTEMP